LFLCVEWFLFTAAASEDAPLDCSTEPRLNAAMFGETFTARDLASAFCEIEFDAFWLWRASCDFGAEPCLHPRPRACFLPVWL
jgi:hypothetical protein